MRRLLDINTWIALSIETHPQNAPARRWYNEMPLVANDLVFCRPTENGFLRLLTQESVMKPCGLVALTNTEAVEFLESVYHKPVVCRADEPPGTRELWLKLAAGDRPSPNVWMDACLAAFAIMIEAELVTFDRGFVKFQSHGLKLRLLASA